MLIRIHRSTISHNSDTKASNTILPPSVSELEIRAAGTRLTVRWVSYDELPYIHMKFLQNSLQ